MDKDYRNRFYERYHRDQERRRLEEIEESAEKRSRRNEDNIFSLLPEDRAANILDAGCGSGHLLSVLKDHGYTNIKGVDVSRDQIEAARRRGVTNVEEADLFEYFDRSDDSWQVILALDLIEHFSKDEAIPLLQHMYKRLEEGGLLIVRTPNIDAPFGSVYAYGDLTHEMILNKSSASQLFKTVGFSRIHIESSHPVDREGIKGGMQRVVRKILRMGVKAVFFAFGRSMQQVELGPNLLITAKK